MHLGEFFAIFAISGTICWLFTPIARGLGKRIEGRAAVPPEVLGEVAELRARIAELEARESHVADLEQRLEFAERLLARGADVQVLPGPGGR
ncbi:MAG: hypothetical protein NW201_04380 [Gemmatimonadales bacterium]|nr:hypothetical protein [Gemmatimonadales bacterium]